VRQLRAVTRDPASPAAAALAPEAEVVAGDFGSRPGRTFAHWAADQAADFR
jgi:hypothetical protein